MIFEPRDRRHRWKRYVLYHLALRRGDRLERSYEPEEISVLDFLSGRCAPNDGTIGSADLTKRARLELSCISTEQGECSWSSRQERCLLRIVRLHTARHELRSLRF